MNLLLAGAAGITLYLTFKWGSRRLDEISKRQNAQQAGQVSVIELTAALNGLSEAMTKASPGLDKIGDNSFLIARGARDIADGVTALRTVVFGGKRAEDFPSTVNEEERTNRANIEYDIGQLMLDHGMSRPQAEARVRDMYAGRRAG